MGVDDGGSEHIGENVDSHRQSIVLNLGVVAGVFLRGEGVVLSPHGIKRDRNIECRATRGSLEEQVFKEVGRAVSDMTFVS